MQKGIVRFVALMLVPCLVGDPTFVWGALQSDSFHRFPAASFTITSFQQQALTAPVIRERKYIFPIPIAVNRENQLLQAELSGAVPLMRKNTKAAKRLLDTLAGRLQLDVESILGNEVPQEEKLMEPFIAPLFTAVSRVLNEYHDHALIGPPAGITFANLVLNSIREDSDLSEALNDLKKDILRDHRFVLNTPYILAFLAGLIKSPIKIKKLFRRATATDKVIMSYGVDVLIRAAIEGLRLALTKIYKSGRPIPSTLTTSISGPALRFAQKAHGELDVAALRTGGVPLMKMSADNRAWLNQLRQALLGCERNSIKVRSHIQKYRKIPVPASQWIINEIHAFNIVNGKAKKFSIFPIPMQTNILDSFSRIGDHFKDIETVCAQKGTRPLNEKTTKNVLSHFDEIVDRVHKLVTTIDEWEADQAPLQIEPVEDLPAENAFPSKRNPFFERIQAAADRASAKAAAIEEFDHLATDPLWVGPGRTLVGSIFLSLQKEERISLINLLAEHTTKTLHRTTESEATSKMKRLLNQSFIETQARIYTPASNMDRARSEMTFLSRVLKEPLINNAVKKVLARRISRLLTLGHPRISFVISSYRSSATHFIHNLDNPDYLITIDALEFALLQCQRFESAISPKQKKESETANAVGTEENADRKSSWIVTSAWSHYKNGVQNRQPLVEVTRILLLQALQDIVTSGITLETLSEQPGTSQHLYNIFMGGRKLPVRYRPGVILKISWAKALFPILVNIANASSESTAKNVKAAYDEFKQAAAVSEDDENRRSGALLLALNTLIERGWESHSILSDAGIGHGRQVLTGPSMHARSYIGSRRFTEAEELTIFKILLERSNTPSPKTVKAKILYNYRKLVASGQAPEDIVQYTSQITLFNARSLRIFFSQPNAQTISINTLSPLLAPLEARVQALASRKGGSVIYSFPITFVISILMALYLSHNSDLSEIHHPEIQILTAAA